MVSAEDLKDTSESEESQDQTLKRRQENEWVPLRSNGTYFIKFDDSYWISTNWFYNLVNCRVALNWFCLFCYSWLPQTDRMEWNSYVWYAAKRFSETILFRNPIFIYKFMFSHMKCCWNCYDIYLIGRSITIWKQLKFQGLVVGVEGQIRLLLNKERVFYALGSIPIPWNQ